MECNALSQSKKATRIVKNISISFGTKIVLMLLNIIIPRLFIVSYGSETNGLLSTITQIFGYLALLEAGIGTASINALYKPLDQQNKEQVEDVLGQSQAYFRKVTLFYVLGMLGFAIVYPLVAGSTIDKWTIFGIILLQGASNCLTYYFSAAYTQLLIADGKNYLVDVIAFAISVGTSLVKIILVSAGYNIMWVQAGYFVVSIAKIPAILFLCRKKYPSLKIRRTKRYDALRERGAFVIHEISATLFSGTDVFLISTFCSFALASVYSVYHLVFGALNTMINTANSGLGFLLGQNYYKDRAKFLKLYDRYSALYSTLVFVVMTIAYIMMMPFISLYTAGVTDIDYKMVGLPLLFAIINLMSGVRAVAARLITVSGHAEKTQYRSILETGINLLASIILVNWIGIYGVLFGTIIALLYRMNDIIIYANKVILERNPWHEYKRLLLNGAIFAAIIVIEPQLKLSVSSYVELFLLAALVAVAVVIIYGVALLITSGKLFLQKEEQNESSRSL